MVCLFAILASFAPRIAFLILWLFTPIIDRAFNTFIFPLLGVIFLPFTTLMHALVVAPLGNSNFWGWLCVVMGLLIDLRSYHDAYENRGQFAIPGMAKSSTV